MNFVEELRWRGMLHDIMPGTEEELNKKMTSGYIGFDPTADSLHVGHLTQIMTLIHFQRAGHKPFALIGGATGMVGAWLVKELVAQGSDVVVLIRDSDPQSELFRSRTIEKVTVVNGVLEDLWTIERGINEHEVDTVFHLGAQTIVGTARRLPFQSFESNVRGTYNLLEVCRLHQSMVKRIVVASSDKAYVVNSVVYLNFV